MGHCKQLRQMIMAIERFSLTSHAAPLAQLRADPHAFTAAIYIRSFKMCQTDKHAD